MTELLNKNEVLEIVEGAFGLDDYAGVMASLGNSVTRKGFGTYETEPTLKEDKFGRISITRFFTDSQNYFSLPTLEELNEVMDGVDWEEKTADNTYNYGGYLERDMNMLTFVNDDTEACVTFYAVHIGLDIRGGYTKYFPVVYDTYEDHLYHLTERFNIASASYEIDGVKHEIYVDAEACSEYLDVAVTDPEGNVKDWAEMIDLDMYDREDFEESLRSFIKNDSNSDISNLEID